LEGRGGLTGGPGGPTAPRASHGAKAAVRAGPLSRGGCGGAGARAAGHGSKEAGHLAPAGVSLAGENEPGLCFTPPEATGDFIADAIEGWRGRGRSAGKARPPLGLGNGPEGQGHRSQFLPRMTRLGQAEQVTVWLACCPPRRGKHNPTERRRGILENHRRGGLLGGEAAALGHGGRRTRNGKRARADKAAEGYPIGAKMALAGRERLERFVQRRAGLEEWFAVIPPPSPNLIIRPAQVIAGDSLSLTYSTIQNLRLSAIRYGGAVE
jgi:hypothetical protein